MPSKVEILNSSSDGNIIIKIGSIKPGGEQTSNIQPNSSKEFVVKGGTKMLKVYSEKGKIWWEGMIPSYASFPIIINPLKNLVTYGGRSIVNFLEPSESCGTHMRTIVVIVTVMLLIAILLYIIAH
jgi:hypothetical protein